MKWIGQQIYDLASRFRNDVFLEDISSGTIASGAHLGLDSNNKIVKAVDGGGDVTLAGIQTFTGAKIIATDVKLGFRDNNSYIEDLPTQVIAITSEEKFKKIMMLTLTKEIPSDLEIDNNIKQLYIKGLQKNSNKEFKKLLNLRQDYEGPLTIIISK